MGSDCLYNEHEILNRIAEGDQRAFSLLVEKYSVAIYTHVLVYIKNAFRAEEIVQDIFMSVWNHRSELPSIENFAGYLYIITRNRTNSAFRERIFRFNETNKDELEAPALNPAGILEFRQLSETLRRGIDELPQRRREIFTMSRFGGKSYEEIARHMGISKSAVNKHIIEALLFLRTYLRDRLGYLVIPLLLTLCSLS